jgi:hypothetical protein
VTAAHVQDRDGAKQLLAILRHKVSRLRPIWADGADTAPLVDGVRALRPPRPICLEITTRADRAQGVVVIPNRGTVERTLGWCNRSPVLQR